MSEQRMIIEMGMGNDQYGQDYTKAAGACDRGCDTALVPAGL